MIYHTLRIDDNVHYSKKEDNYYNAYIVRNTFNKKANEIYGIPDDGFYHYPDTMSDQEAFSILKESMIDDRRDRIEDLLQEIKQLEKLKLKQE